MTYRLKSSQFREAVLAGIRSGRYPEGGSLGTAQELSEEYDVALITVNRTLSAMAKEGLVIRRRKSGSFVARGAAKNCRRSYHIGLCFHFRFSQLNPDLFTAFGYFSRYAEYYLEKHGHTFEYISFEELHHEEFLQNKKFDGFLTSVSVLDENTIPVLLRKKCPVVTVLQTYPEDLPFHQVIPDLSEIFYEAALKIRARKIHSIRILYSEESISQIRAGIFWKSARWAGFSAEQLQRSSVCHQHGDWGKLDGYRLAEQELQWASPDTLFFIPSDFVSFGFLRFMLEKEKRPGVDFHLLSFDDMEGENVLPFGEPMLSSVTFPKQKIVEEALKLLFHQIEQPGAQKSILKLPCKIILRKTFA